MIKRCVSCVVVLLQVFGVLWRFVAVPPAHTPIFSIRATETETTHLHTSVCCAYSVTTSAPDNSKYILAGIPHTHTHFVAVPPAPPIPRCAYAAIIIANGKVRKGVVYVCVYLIN